MYPSERALTGLPERAEGKRATATHPLYGRLAKGQRVSLPKPRAVHVATTSATATAKSGPGVLGTALLISAAVALLLWVLGFGLTLISYLAMHGQ